MDSHKFKIVLIGDGGVGKTTFVKRHLTGEFEKRYVPTSGVEVHPLTFHTNHGKVTFNLWDTSGTERFEGLRDGYYPGAHGAMLFFTVDNRVSYNHIPTYDALVRCAVGDIPTVLCANKVDVRDRQVKPTQIKYHHGQKGRAFAAYNISARSNYNFEKPFLYLARMLMGKPDLEFTERPAIAPPTVILDEQQLLSE